MANGKIDKALQHLFGLAVDVKLLWENASPASAFAAQDINIGEYDMYVVFAALQVGDGNTTSAVIRNGKRGIVFARGFSVAPYGIITRAIAFKDGIATVSHGYYQATYGNDTADSKKVIPLEIYGAKLIGGGYNLIRKVKCLLHGRGCFAW